MTGLALLATIAWVLVAITQVRVALRLEMLPERVAAELPRLSVLIPACNEQATLVEALKSLLAVDYPDLEVVLVNDRSSDATGDLMESLAAGDGRVRVVHVQELPPRWLGKTHALQLAGRAARGEWLLFTDADVHFEPDALKRAVSLAMERKLDHLCLGPRLVCGTFWEKIFVSFFCTAFFFRYRPDLVDRPGPFYVGVGAFNLVRASVYRQLGGHSALAMQVLDDMELGRLVKGRGFRQGFVGAGQAVRVRWAAGLRDQVQVLEKNAFGGLGYSPGFAALASLITLVGSLAPLWLWSCGSFWWGLLGFLCMQVCALSSAPGLGSPRWAGLVFPLAGVLMVFIMLRSCWLGMRRGGIVWRGTFYSLEELRAEAPW
ncbi:MAG: glycosyltransferase [Candidatus Eremiobacteraeota bacterium]|nr:glycosyltransferase [Candidatus Eremiobacteraeota bacterium]MCW5866747.1 glycosyltransferase [Candidatus Eremiobacteraeota bacterium]